MSVEKNQQDRNASLMRAATYASVSVATVLIVAKLGAWVMTGSVSLLSTLVDSVLDVLASLVNMYAVRQALTPADDDHRFGHGKAEPLAGLAQSAFIGGSSLFLLFQAGERLINPKEIGNSEIGFAVMGLSIALTLGLIIFQRYVIKKTDSVAIKADSLHYQSDLFVNLGVAASIYLTVKMGWAFADPIFAIAIAAFIVKGAWEIAIQSLDLLMDHELPEDQRSKIKKIILSREGVRGVHDLRTRSSGPDSFIQAHIEMDPELKLHEAHVIADDVMYAVEAAFPKAEVLIHQDPAGIEEAPPIYEANK
ncbi:MAG: cation diffusion facilitator family transporter [Alphaproteobacteria bacterium]|nr:cation diffusion facilitator family transporter [Rhodospirillales bacterium]MCW9046045.1 cation diffusion facilitator family transporter [Alphaproteobacteria bacterium]